jgi:formate dehydrogenase alpha subunit
MQKDITFLLDGKKITAPEGSILLQVAKDHGVIIPSLCYHKRLTPTGACRLCLVKIQNMNGLIASCTVKVQEGMEVTAFDDELEESRREVLEYLISEHNEESDGAYNDELTELVVRYNLDKSENRKYPSVWKSLNYPVEDTSPVLTYDASKCIKCFRCIKACEEIQGKSVLTFTERGLSAYIVAGLGVWNESECDGCGECIQLCPTGAIVEKPHRSKVKVNEIVHKTLTTCPYCGVGCQIELWEKNGKIVRSNGVEGVLPNDGRLCVKGRFGYEFVNSEKRLTHPLIRQENGEFCKASWEDAMSLIASKFTEIKRRHGTKALAGYSSAKCTNEDNYLFQKFIRTVFGNNNVDYCTRLCHASTVTAMLRSIGDGAGSNSIVDFENCDCLLVTGNNIIETHPITATYVKRGAAKGMKIIVIDPRWTPLVKYSTLWLQPKLGTDVALHNGLIHIIIRDNMIDENFIETRVDGGMEAFKLLKLQTEKYTPEIVEEITGVSISKLTEAAYLYATSPTSMIATGMGLSQQVTGTNNVFTLINMMLITGQIGKECAGINPPRGQNNVQGATDVGVSPLNYPGYISVSNEENRKKVAMEWGFPFEKLSGEPGLTTVEIMKAIHKGEIKGMYIMGENPVVTDPNQNHTRESLKKLDFMVVQDIFFTETAPYAHVILPAATFAEKNGTFVNSDRRVLRVRKAVESPGEARQDWRIIHELAARMGIPMYDYASESEIFDEIARVTPMMAGVSYERLENGSIQWPCPQKDHPGTSTLFLERFNTPNGKGKLNPVDYVLQNEKVSDEFPFLLNSGRLLSQYHSSTMSRKCESLNAYSNEAYVLMNELDGNRRGLIENQIVRVFNNRGELKAKLVLTDQVLEGELFMPWHFSEAPVNALTRDELDPDSKIAPFKLSAVQVKAV